ncbi:hypothetical protein ABH926_005715 [Catenulispora sp. GP43]|uniref:STM3941 family protein n=1 Tax=Catenulispora sp. GP43 TaxID=3156263 RepID=UPI003513FC05
MPPTIFLPSRGRLVLLTLGALGFVVVSGGLAVADPGIRTVPVAVVAVPFFGYAGVLSALRLVRRGPELTVTDEGFEHRQLGRVAWSEVEVVAMRSFTVRATTKTVIEVVLHDPDRYLARRPASAKLLARTNERWGFSPVTISAVALPDSLEEVLAVMQQRHQQFLGRTQAAPSSD